jgi:adenosylhomocysteine nucleosidase/adenosylhomocysteine/aminodeoxyfutalosine nucleosidase
MICIHICSDYEWKTVKRLLKAHGKINTFVHGEYFKHDILGRECLIYQGGETKTKSSASCQYMIDKKKPEMIIVLGTCGGVSDKLKIGDVIIANKTVQYDCINKMGTVIKLFYEAFNIDIDISWIDFSYLPERVFPGMVATADQDMDFLTRVKLQDQNVLGADWESGAIAYVCKVNDVKCYIVRGVSDIPKKRGKVSERQQAKDLRKYTPVIMKKLINSVLPGLIMQLD